MNSVLPEQWSCSYITACANMLTRTQQCHIDWPKGLQLPAPLERRCLKLVPEPSGSEAAIFSPFTPNYHSLSRKSSVAPSVPSATDRDALITLHCKAHLGKDYTSHNAASDIEPLLDANTSQGVGYKHWPQPCMGYVQWCALKWSHFMSRISHTAQQDWCQMGFVWSICNICRQSISSSHQTDTQRGWSCVVWRDTPSVHYGT